MQSISCPHLPPTNPNEWNYNAGKSIQFEVERVANENRESKNHVVRLSGLLAHHSTPHAPTLRNNQPASDPDA
jgi:hypothetical protein